MVVPPAWRSYTMEVCSLPTTGVAESGELVETTRPRCIQLLLVARSALAVCFTSFQGKVRFAGFSDCGSPPIIMRALLGISDVFGLA